MTGKVPGCSRCGKRLHGNVEGWNVLAVAGYITGYLCPNCQTPQEDLEAELELIRHGERPYGHPLHQGDNDVHRYLVALLNSYPTPEIMRAKASELAAARPDLADLADGPVALMRRLADEMESRELRKEDDASP